MAICMCVCKELGKVPPLPRFWFNPGQSRAALTLGLRLQHSDRGTDTLNTVSPCRDRSPGSQRKTSPAATLSLRAETVPRLPPAARFRLPAHTRDARKLEYIFCLWEPCHLSLASLALVECSEVSCCCPCGRTVGEFHSLEWLEIVW